MPLMTTFSRPVISGWKPAPSSISAVTRPSTDTSPVVGLQNSSGQLEQSRLTGPVGPDHGQGPPQVRLRDRGGRGRRAPRSWRPRLTRRRWKIAPLTVSPRALDVAPSEDLADAAERNRPLHTASTRVSRKRRENPRPGQPNDHTDHEGQRPDLGRADHAVEDRVSIDARQNRQRIQLEHAYPAREALRGPRGCR